MTAEILLVDDNAVQASTRHTILSRSGRTVAVAAGALQALAKFEDEQLLHSINLVITDHWMPGMNGPEFITLLRRRLPVIPVLVLSGLPDAEEEYAGLDVIFRIKPLAPDQLIALVESLLDSPMGRTA
jgi:DNA-binding response OmpR family regulator